MKGKARPHRYSGRRRGGGSKEMKEREAEKEDRDVMGTIARGAAIKEGGF